MDDYLKSLKQEAFNNDDGDVILIDPGIDYQKLFKGIDLPCIKEKRINNSLNAPIRTTAFDAMPKKQFNEDEEKVNKPKNAVLSIHELNKKMMNQLRERAV